MAREVKIVWRCTSCRSLYIGLGWGVRKCPWCGKRAATVVPKEAD